MDVNLSQNSKFLISLTNFHLLLPAWTSSRLGAPVFYKPLTYLFNMSISTSTVPYQWKFAAIQPVPKVPTTLPRPSMLTSALFPSPLFSVEP